IFRGKNDDGAADAFVIELVEIVTFVQIENPGRFVLESKGPDSLRKVSSRRLFFAGARIVPVQVVKVSIWNRNQSRARFKGKHVGAGNYHELSFQERPVPDYFGSGGARGLIAVRATHNHYGRTGHATVVDV